MSDLISRKAAIKLCDWYEQEYSEVEIYFQKFNEELKELPSAEKTGEWIPEEDEVGLRWFRCSECRRIVSDTHKSKYCPNCGAKMEG